MDISYVAVVMIVILLIVFLFVFWFLFSGLKGVLIDDIQEAIITAGEDIGQRIDNMQINLTARVKALQSYLENLEKVINAITSQPQSAPSALSLPPEVFEGMSNMFNELRKLRQEMKRFLQDLADKPGSPSSSSHVQINEKTFALLDKEIKKLTGAITDSIKQLHAAGSEYSRLISEMTANFRGVLQASNDETKKIAEMVTASTKDIEETGSKNKKLLSDMASSFQGVLKTSSNDIRTAFAETDDELKKIITASMESINKNYEDNMRQIFKAMADNLASIKEVLSGDYSIRRSA